MTSETPAPETLQPSNGSSDDKPINPLQCQILQETISAQIREFAGLKDSILGLRDSTDQLKLEMRLFRESIASILARWADTVLVEHHQQGQQG